MEVRSYYATTVEAAMMLARKELGADALLIQSTHSSPELAHLGKYEVVFAGELQKPKARPALKSAPRSNPYAALETKGELLPPPLPIDIAELPGIAPVDLLRDRSPDLRSPAFAALLARVAAAAEPAKAARVSGRIPCSPGLGSPGDPAPMVALAGPCGSGKTTTIMKLALVHGLLVSRPVRLFALDPQRIGATVRLQNFAEVLSLSFTEFETPGQLSRALEFPFDGLTLIDVAESSLAVCLQAHPQVETQLVLRADRKTADNIRALESLSKLSPSRLILTALDQTTDRADLLTLINRSSLPVSFLCLGERIPEDIEPASIDRLMSLMRGEKSRNARSAA